MSWVNLGVPGHAFRPGLTEIGNGVYAWLAPDGSWGWSNAGLVCDGSDSLLVDTLFDLHLTREMLVEMRKAEPVAAERIDSVVNTHANGDHCHGNQLVADARIIASKATAGEMQEVPPAAMAEMAETLGSEDTSLGRFIRRAFGPFDFRGIELVPPTETFEGELSVQVGGRRVELIEVGPAHTAGDVLAYLPAERVVFTGDILFVEGTPIIWAGPVSNWIAACDRILAMDPELVVPGHGPITDRRGVLAVKAYLEYLSAEARQRYDAGLSALEAARDIPLGDFSSWSDSERIVVNVYALYREFSGTREPEPVMKLMAEMAEFCER